MHLKRNQFSYLALCLVILMFSEDLSSQEISADFFAMPRRGMPSLEVEFTNITNDTVSSFLWVFGDGGHSRDINPVHTYTDYGSYSVTLIVAGKEGSDTLVKSDYIQLTRPIAFDFSPPITLDKYAQGALSVKTPDINLDGKPDIIFGSYTGDTEWYRNQFRSQLSSGSIPLIPVPESYREVFIEMVDLNGDEYPDILTLGNDKRDSIMWHENSGGGSFKPPVLITSEFVGPVSFYAKDLDGDSDMDLMTASEGDEKLAWYENDGTGNFGEQIMLADSVRHLYRVYSEDLDGDGLNDIIFSSLWYTYRMMNLGNGAFSERILLDPAYGAQSFNSADMDADGDMDIVTHNYGDKVIRWFENDGTGNARTSYEMNFAPAYPVFFLPADLNQDGFVDLLVTTMEPSQILYIENSGYGIFESPKLFFSNGYTPGRYDVADLDSDGDPDVLCALGFDGLVWFQNQGEYINLGLPGRNNLLEKTLLVFPNPAAGTATVTFQVNEPGRVRLGAFNSLGGLKESKLLDINSTGLQKINLDVSRYLPGLYFLRLEGEGGILGQGRLLVQ